MLRLIATILALLCFSLPVDAHQAKLQRHTQFISGVASWYDCRQPGECSPSRRTASGEIFDAQAHKCAMLVYPIGTHVRIQNVSNGRQSYCTVNDHGPYVSGRIIDVTPVVRDELGFAGVAEVRIYPE